jgi:hypothetical protein
MKMNKVLPILLLVVMLVATLLINKCNNSGTVRPRDTERRTRENRTEENKRTYPRTTKTNKVDGGLDRSGTDLFFTKHAKCRMKCRKITQQEVKDILAKGTVNYNKSNLNDPKGATYALEGNTDDGQHVRIIFAPKQKHLTVVTVIDLETEFECDCK